VGGLAAFFVIAALAQGSPSPAETTPEAELLHLESVWNEAHLHGDAEALDRLWADDLVVIVPRMDPLTKAAALAFMRSGRFTFERYETSDTAVRVYGDVALVHGRLKRARRMKDRLLEDDWRFTKAYVRREGQWKVVSFHASETAT